MSRVFNIFFCINIRIAEEILSFTLTKLHINFNFFIAAANSHTLAAAARCCFKNNRVTYTICKFLNFFNSFNNPCSRSNRHIVFYHCFTCSCFITHFAHSFRTWADKFYSLFFANFGKISTF